MGTGAGRGLPNSSLCTMVIKPGSLDLPTLHKGVGLGQKGTGRPGGSGIKEYTREGGGERRGEQLGQRREKGPKEFEDKNTAQKVGQEKKREGMDGRTLPDEAPEVFFPQRDLALSPPVHKCTRKPKAALE